MAAAFFVLCLFYLEDSRFENLRSRHGTQLSQLDFSIGRQDLPRPTEPFRSDVQLTNGNLPLDGSMRLSGVASSESKVAALADRLRRVEDQKKKAEDKLAASTERLKLLDVQRRQLDYRLRERSHWIFLAMMGALVGYAAFSRLSKARNVVVGNEV
jgi:hypothetical protein